MLGTTNISTTLVRNTLGETTNSIGKLCTSSKINPWSKRKPVIFPHDSTDGYPDWWKAADGNCGFNIGDMTLPSSNVERVMSEMDAGNQKWTYQPPTGGWQAPYRLGDFREYLHTATPAVEASVPSTIVISGNQSYDFSVKFNKSGGGLLALSDIGTRLPFADMYLACCIADASKTQWRWKTSTDKVGSGVMSVSMPLNGLTGGKYKAYFFLSKDKRDDYLGPVIATDMVLLPVEVQNFTLRTDGGVGITILAERGNLGNITVKIVIVNDSDGDKTLHDCYLMIKYADNNILSPLEATESSNSLGDIVAPANQTTIVNKHYLSALRDFDTRGGHVYFRVNTPNITKEETIIKPRN